MSLLKDVERQVLPKNGQKAYVYDDEVKGLAVRFTSSGHRSFVVRFLNANTRRHEYLKIGDYGSFDIKKARDLARIKLGELQTTLAIGLDPKQERKKAAGRQMTLREALDKYITDKSDKKMQRHLSEAAQRDYRSCIQHNLQIYLDRPIADLGKEEFLRIYSLIGKSKPRTATKLGRYTRAVLNYINEENDGALFTANPIALALSGRLYAAVRKQTFVQFERMPEFFEVLSAQTEDDQDFIKLALFSGLRAGAIRTLKWKNLDLEVGIMHVYEAEMHKGTSPLPLSNLLIALLKDRKARATDCEWVFPGRADGPLVEHKKVFARLAFPAEKGVLASEINQMDGVEIKLITSHDLRRTFATAAASIGLGESIIGDLLLHKKSNSVTAGYIIRQMKFLKDCVDQIESEILRLSRV